MEQASEQMIFDVAAQNARLLKKLELGLYEFIDMGTHEGAGFGIAKHFDCDIKRGLGFELNPAKAKALNAKGIDVICGDICSFALPQAKVRIAIMNHILEHLPNTMRVGALLDRAAACCSDYLYISGPYFDSERYLFENRLKALHTTITEHTSRFTTFELVDILNSLGLRDYYIAGEIPILDSDDAWLHRSDAPDNVWTYEARYGEKPKVKFDRPICRNFICLVQLRKGIPLVALAESMNGLYPLFRSNYHY
jgi:hypothetical protein